MWKKKILLFYGYEYNVIHVRVLWNRMTFWKYEIKLILKLCAQCKVFIFRSVGSYDSKLHSLQILSQPTQSCWHNATPLLPTRFPKSKFPASSSFKFLLIYKAPNISNIHGHRYGKTVLSKLVSGLDVWGKSQSCS